MNDYQPWSRGEPPHEGPAPTPPRDRLQFHPAANLFPLLTEDSVEFRGLVDDIRTHGLQEPITLHEGMILDGRNRHRACRAAGIAPRFEQFDDSATSACEFVFAKNLHRRHLTVGQRALLAAEAVTTAHGGDRTSKSSHDPLLGEKITISDAATMWSVSPASIKRAAFVREQAPPSIVDQVKAGTLELGLADTIANKTPEEQRAHPLVKFARRTPSQRPAARPVTVPAIRALTDEQLFAVVTRELHRINRAAAREGRQVIITDLPQQKGLAF
jgi:ParB-like chromosome segregation protein Spo0J